MKTGQGTESSHYEPPLMLNGLEMAVQTALCAVSLD